MKSLHERADERNKVLLVQKLSELSEYDNLLKVTKDEVTLLQKQLSCNHEFQSKSKSIDPVFIKYKCSKCGCFIFGSDTIKEL